MNEADQNRIWLYQSGELQGHAREAFERELEKHPDWRALLSFMCEQETLMKDVPVPEPCIDLVEKALVHAHPRSSLCRALSPWGVLRAAAVFLVVAGGSVLLLTARTRSAAERMVSSKALDQRVKAARTYTGTVRNFSASWELSTPRAETLLSPGTIPGMRKKFDRISSRLEVLRKDLVGRTVDKSSGQKAVAGKGRYI